MTRVTFVKKILASGEACKKCREVSDRLHSEDLMQYIDETLIADERDLDSPGMVLAKKLGVTRAPFFVIEDESGEIEVIDIYFKFKKRYTG